MQTLARRAGVSRAYLFGQNNRHIFLHEYRTRNAPHRSPALPNVYTSRYTIDVAQGIEFEWDDENRKHLAAHNVTPAEFEYVLTNNAVDLGYELIDDEERYRAVGLTSAGRLLTVVWTPRNGSVRPVTAFPATVSDKKAFLEVSQ